MRDMDGIATSTVADRDTARTHRRAGTRSLSVSEKIDVSRGLFACLVVVAHALEVSWGVHPDGPRQMPGWLMEIIKIFPGNGIFWVMGFFVISGYCIHLSVIRTYRHGQFPLGTYLTARVTRLLPLYYVALGFALVVERLIADARPDTWLNGLHGLVVLSQLLCLQNLTQTYGAFAPSWSITNEFAYYVLYGLLALALSGGGRRLSAVALAICLAVACATQAVYLFLVRHPIVYSTGMLFGLGVSWCLGAVVAQHSRVLLARGWLRILARCWPAFLATGIYWHYDHRLPVQGVYAWCRLAFTLMLLRFLDQPTAQVEGAEARPGKSREWVRLFGLTSYPMYLFHGPFLMLVGSAILRWHLILDWRVTWGVLAVLGIAMGLVLGVAVEQPLLAWRETFLRARRERVAGRTSAPCHATG